METLTEAAWKIPYAIRVDSVTNFQHSWADGDDLTVEDLIRNGASLSQDNETAKKKHHDEDRHEPELLPHPHEAPEFP